MLRIKSFQFRFTTPLWRAVPRTRQPLVRCFIQSSPTKGSRETNPPTTPGVPKISTQQTTAEPVVGDQQKIEPPHPPKPRKPATTVDEELPPLTPEQKEVLDAILEGRNVFIGGPIGSGEGAIIEHLAHHLSRLGKPYQVLNLSTNFETARPGWQSIGHFFPFHKIPPDCALDRARWQSGWVGDLLWATQIWIWSNLATRDHFFVDHWKMYRDSRERLRRPEVVVMTGVTSTSLSLTVFEKMNMLVRVLWEKPQCFFGGAQLVLVGDFFQMHSPSLASELKMLSGCLSCGAIYPKPLPTNYTCARCKQSRDTDIRHLFEGPSWTEAKFRTFILRRKSRNLDPVWEDIVDKCRFGKPDAETLQVLESLQESHLPIRNIKPSQIHASNHAASAKNAAEFQTLPGEPTIFAACDVSRHEIYERSSGQYERTSSKPIAQMIPYSDVKADNILKLKLGSQVMLTATIDAGLDLIPGSRGVVDGFIHPSKTEFLAAAADEKTARLYSKYFDISCNPVTKRITIPMVTFYSLLQRKGTPESVPVFPRIFRQKYPLSSARHKNYRDSFVSIERRQIPLKLAWALPMTQILGITVDYAQIDVNDMNEPGYMYTALSCVRRPEGLQLLAADRNHLAQALKCDPAVIKFYEGLASQAQEINDAVQ